MFQLLTKSIPQSCKSSLCKRPIWRCITHSYHVVSCISAKWDAHIDIWRFWRQRWTKSVLYFANKKNQRKKFTISEELYTQVMNFKEIKVNNGTYQIRSFTTPTGKTITGHFVFDLTRSNLQKKFQESLQS